MNRYYTKKRRSLSKKKRKSTFRKQRGSGKKEELRKAAEAKALAEEVEKQKSLDRKVEAASKLQSETIRRIQAKQERAELAERDARREEIDQKVRQTIGTAINDDMNMKEKREIIKDILKVNYPEKTEHNLNVESFIRSSLRKKGNFKPRNTRITKSR